MTYRLRLDPTIHSTYRALTDTGRANLAVALVDALADPIAASTPYGIDDGIMRTIARGLTTAVLLVDDKSKTLTVVQVNSAD